MKKIMSLCALLLFAVSMSAFGYAQTAAEGLNQSVTGGKIQLTVTGIGEVTNYEDLVLNENYEKIADELASLKEAMARGEVKCIFVDVTMKNLSNKAVSLGHRLKKFGVGEFTLFSEDGTFQDSGNRKEFYEEFTVTGVIVSGRRVMALSGGLLPEKAEVESNSEISGKVLFVVPTAFSPVRMETKANGIFGPRSLVINVTQ